MGGRATSHSPGSVRWRNADITKEGRAEKGGALKLATKKQQAAQGGKIVLHMCNMGYIYTMHY